MHQANILACGFFTCCINNETVKIKLEFMMWRSSSRSNRYEANKQDGDDEEDDDYTDQESFNKKVGYLNRHRKLGWVFRRWFSYPKLEGEKRRFERTGHSSRFTKVLLGGVSRIMQLCSRRRESHKGGWKED